MGDMTKLATGALAMAVGWGLGGGGCTLNRGPAHARHAEIAQDRNVSEFRSIGLEGAFHLDVAVGSPQRVSLEGKAGVLEHVVTSVEDGQLTIQFDAGKLPRAADVRVTIVTPQLAAVQAEGAAELDIVGLNGPDLSLEVEGATRARLGGEVEALSVELVGAGSLDALDLLAQSVDIAIVGAGVANVTAVAQLDAEIAGTGRVRYRGDPAVAKTVHGVGRVRRF